MTLPLELYEDALAGPAGAVRMRSFGEDCRRLPVDRWLGPVLPEEAGVLARAVGPVLDVGCGPGRHVHALARLGVLALGLDVSELAVRLAQRRGVEAVQGDVFDAVPGLGTWRTVLLLDGNVGIGGSAAELLARIHSALAAGGRVLAELDPPGTSDEPRRMRLERGEQTSRWFEWGTLAADRLEAVAARAGFDLRDAWTERGRWFAELERRT